MQEMQEKRFRSLSQKDPLDRIPADPGLGPSALLRHGSALATTGVATEASRVAWDCAPLGRPPCAREEAHHPLLPTQVIGHSNFGTIRSTTCVYKGEAMLHHGPGSWQGVRGPRPQAGGSLCLKPCRV